MASPQPLEKGQIYLGNYLLERLAQLDVKSMLGVPGDFNLTFLDLVEEHEKVNWVGCCNELNAGYAADGYARVKQSQANFVGSKALRNSRGGVKGFSALLTTFGVGELSAMNAVAGAYAERVPLLHIVGAPSTAAQKNKFLLHHTLGDGSFNVFEQSAKGVTAAQAFLQTGGTAACEEIDRVIRTAFEKARPSYLTFPTDLVFSPVSAARLDTPLIPDAISAKGDRAELPTGEKLSKEELGRLDFAVKECDRLWQQAKNPVILVDACAIRYGVCDLTRQLCESTGCKWFTTPMGKGGLTEDYEKGFAGIYVGEISDKHVKESFEAADLVIFVGSLQSDFNSGEFTQKLATERTIELHSNSTKVGFAVFPEVGFHSILPELTKKLQPKQVKDTPEHAGLIQTVPDGPADETVKHEAFWAMWSKFLRPDDILIAETGTSSFGVLDVKLPPGAILLSQVLWGSIGWAGGALLGGCLAALEAEFDRRVILFIGDGSLQLTVQDISTMMKHNLKPIIVVLNNSGYTIEKLINGKYAEYNNISSWNWQNLLEFFDADNKVEKKSWLAKTRREFEQILNDKEFAKADKIQLLEVRMDKLDAPRALQLQAELSAKLNSS